MQQRAAILAKLSGAGIEIGALHRPADVPHLKVNYVDRLTVKELLTHYPELEGQPIVEPDILDDAETLATLLDCSQDFVIANHVIEHMSNPVLAVRNWLRLLKPNGKLFLAVPDKNQTFDRERALTPFEHLELDYTKPDKARDFEHFKDFALFVSCRTFNVRPESESKVLADHLCSINYSILYHVWDFSTFKDFLNASRKYWLPMEFSVVETAPTEGDEFIFLLERTA